jgi:hypothetical protein
MSKKNNQYIGQGGHHFVMAELLCRGWNVAIPDVDKGDDLFVVQDDNGDFRRVQVKTATAITFKKKKGFAVDYILRLDQLRKPATPELHYIFVSRLLDRWEPLLIIERNELFDLHTLNQVGSVSKRKNGPDMLRLHFQFTPIATNPRNYSVTCSKHDFSAFVNRWGFFRIIPH